MDIASEVVRASFNREVVKLVDKISNVLWPWTVPSGVSDLVKAISAAIELGGLDPKTIKEFSEEEVENLGKKIEMMRRLEMKKEARETLLAALSDHGVVIEISAITAKK